MRPWCDCSDVAAALPIDGSEGGVVDSIRGLEQAVASAIHSEVRSVDRSNVWPGERGVAKTISQSASAGLSGVVGLDIAELCRALPHYSADLAKIWTTVAPVRRLSMELPAKAGR